MRWQHRLTKQQLKHLNEFTEFKPMTLARFRLQREFQLAREMDTRLQFPNATPGMIEACWDCREIAKRIGIE